MVLLIDNYDSFSYNLYQLMGTIREDIRVIRNDKMTVQEIRKLKPEKIVLSPGPGYPKNAGICMEVVRQLGKEIPILGICLGHQSICEAYGAVITYAKELMHGKQSQIYTEGDSPIFKGIGHPFLAARYHSLAVREETLPEDLSVVAKTKDGEIMAVQHRKYPVYGLQFHPESVLTPDGMKMIENYLKL
ncbi:MAG: aminodeoxychorismate/anthranilate synthase component II [Lachnospiraceae bacterium]|nr:aminodeoxychorismate/anthranilate synthase component II [Lachnospiraceae bacterium]